MKESRSKLILSAAGIGLLLTSAIYFVAKHSWRRIHDRVYVIGWHNSPPFQRRAADGSPAGLAVDLVRDAARRQGVRLKWEWHPEGPDSALRSGKVDLWPLITVTLD